MFLVRVIWWVAVFGVVAGCGGVSGVYKRGLLLDERGLPMPHVEVRAWVKQTVTGLPHDLGTAITGSDGFFGFYVGADRLMLDEELETLHSAFAVGINATPVFPTVHGSVLSSEPGTNRKFSLAEAGYGLLRLWNPEPHFTWSAETLYVTLRSPSPEEAFRFSWRSGELDRGVGGSLATTSFDGGFEKFDKATRMIPRGAVEAAGWRVQFLATGAAGLFEGSVHGSRTFEVPLP